VYNNKLSSSVRAHAEAEKHAAAAKDAAKRRDWAAARHHTQMSRQHASGAWWSWFMHILELLSRHGIGRD